MTLDDERRHLLLGPGDDARPSGTEELEVGCERGAATALALIREGLLPVLEHQTGRWPSVDEWKALLPAWFLDACVDDREIQNCVLDRWSLRAWLHWLQPDQRQWRWWGASPSDDGRRLMVRVLPLADPWLRGSLNWLLTVAARTDPDS